MLSTSHVLAFTMTLLLVLSAGHGHGVHAMPCNQAIQDLFPCVPYLSGSGSNQPTPACCSGLRTVIQSATTTQQRIDLCQCIKSAASGASVNPSRAKQLPIACKVKLPVPINPNVNCNAIHA